MASSQQRYCVSIIFSLLVDFPKTFMFCFYFQKMDVSIEIRSKAIGMHKAGLTMKIVAEKQCSALINPEIDCLVGYAR